MYNYIIIYFSQIDPINCNMCMGDSNMLSLIKY